MVWASLVVWASFGVSHNQVQEDARLLWFHNRTCAKKLKLKEQKYVKWQDSRVTEVTIDERKESFSLFLQPLGVPILADVIIMEDLR